MIAGVKKLGSTTRSYKGCAFTYLTKTKKYQKVTLSAYVDGQFTHLRFPTIGQTVSFIDIALASGGHVDGNRLVVKMVKA